MTEPAEPVLAASLSATGITIVVAQFVDYEPKEGAGAERDRLLGTALEDEEEEEEDDDDFLEHTVAIQHMDSIRQMHGKVKKVESDTNATRAAALERLQADYHAREQESNREKQQVKERSHRIDSSLMRYSSTSHPHHPHGPARDRTTSSTLRRTASAVTNRGLSPTIDLQRHSTPRQDARVAVAETILELGAAADGGGALPPPPRSAPAAGDDGDAPGSRGSRVPGDRVVNSV